MTLHKITEFYTQWFSVCVCMYVFIYLLQMDPSPVAELPRH
jgi:hypothetical protein